jgi:hypothetical protein
MVSAPISPTRTHPSDGHLVADLAMAQYGTSLPSGPFTDLLRVGHVVRVGIGETVRRPFLDGRPGVDGLELPLAALVQ